MYIRIVLSVLLMITTPITCKSNKFVGSITLEPKELLDRTPSEVLAAVAFHECSNLSKAERWLVMEALVNRVEDNFNNNGTTLVEQLLAPKQFTGLWKHNPEQFKYDPNDKICTENKRMAEYILSGIRISTRRIYYWAGPCDMQHPHGKFVKRKAINTKSNIKHMFR